MAISSNQIAVPSDVEDSDVSATAASQRRYLLAIVVCVLTIMIDGFDLQLLGILGPALVRDWGLSLPQLGPALGASLLGATVGAIMIGEIQRFVNESILLATCLLLICLTTLATCLTTSITDLVVLRFFSGIALGAAVPIVMAIVAELAPLHLRTTFLTVTLCGQPIGAAAGAALCAWMVPQYGWRSAFILGGVIPVFLAIAVWLRRTDYRRPDSPFRPRLPSQSMVGLLRGDSKRLTLAAWSCTACGATALYMLLNWMPSILEGYGYSLRSGIIAISLFNAGGVCGALILGILRDRLHSFLPVIFAYLAGAAAIVSIDLLQENMRAALSATFLAGFFGYGAAVTLGAIITGLYAPPLRTVGTGWALGFGRTAAALGPVVVGMALALGLHRNSILYVASVLWLTGAAAMLALIRFGKAIEPQPEIRE